MPFPVSRPLRIPSLFRVVICSLALVVQAVPPAPAYAQQAGIGPSSGLPLPRFVSVRNAPTNVRVGPGLQYDVDFTFIHPNVPVEIVQEFDTWRKIRDVEGDEGWVHQNLVVGDRMGFIAPWQEDGSIALRVGPGPDAAIRAWLGPEMLVFINACDGTNCEIRLNHTNPEGETTSYEGFVPQNTLWGVYEGEVFD